MTVRKPLVTVGGQLQELPTLDTFEGALWGDVDLMFITGAGVGSIGVGHTTTGTGTFTSMATTNYRTSTPRVTYTSATTAGSVAGARHNNSVRWRGNAAGLGGFHIVMRFGLTLLTGHQAFIGQGPIAGLSGEPTALTNMFGVGADSTDTNLFIMHKEATGTATKIDTGLPKTTADVLRLTLYAASNGSGVRVQLYNESTRAEVYNGTLTANIPANTAFYGNVAHVRNGTTTTAATIDLMRLYSALPTR